MSNPSPLPEPSICKTKHAFGSYWSCLVDQDYPCPKRFNFGSDHLCRHPDSHDFDSDPDLDPDRKKNL